MHTVITYLTLLFTIVISITGFSQTKYEEGMQKAFELWSNDKPWEAANLFERISNAELDNWLPSYYVAQINTIYSFEEKDKTKFTGQLAKAQEYLGIAKGISKDNPEILVMEALWYTAWIAYDGQQYGMKYSGKVAQLYQQALQIAPDNPHVLFGKAEWDMGAAQFFGQSVEPYCKDLQRAIELFSTFKPESDFHPNYGEDRAKMLAEKTCK
ncbi:hypothetical protein ATE92_2029 [Ulvibacter sp. MAR_2010_11]|uniref:hypothetical protein n=1 Tax=Ulvibacter sp. MAR_2010_11 TaxID=1250229 RepID=UPI000C2BEE3D|nr:hypothetical protein [Ulvibacter sp. MAR_2010_11]PKA83861.1 hypothetical protein ATE92_2029 [Ulvibacter sp. MAR_2010_11]